MSYSGSETRLTKATNIIMVPTRIRFLILAWGGGGGGVGGGVGAPNRLFMKGVGLSLFSLPPASD